MSDKNTDNTNPETNSNTQEIETTDSTRAVEEAAERSTSEAEVVEPVRVAPIASIPGKESETQELFDASVGELALEAIRENLHKIPLSEVRRLHISPPALVTMGLCYAERYQEDRPLFDAAFKPAVFDVTAFDDMNERAMGYWHLTISVRQDAAGPLKMVLAEAKPLRTRMLEAADYLWGKDLNLGDIVATVRSGHAYLDQADDLGLLARLFMDNWDKASGKCDITRSDLLKAQELGARFFTALGQMRINELTELKELRLKAGEYLLRGIYRIREGAGFVFSNDEKRLSHYPSLAIMKRRRKTDGVEEPEDIGEGETEIDDEITPVENAAAALVTSPVAGLVGTE